MAIYNPGSQKAVKWSKRLVYSLNSASKTEIQFLAPEGCFGRAIPPCTHSSYAPLPPPACRPVKACTLSTKLFSLAMASCSSTWASSSCIFMVCCHCCLLCWDTGDSTAGYKPVTHQLQGGAQESCHRARYYAAKTSVPGSSFIRHPLSCHRTQLFWGHGVTWLDTVSPLSPSMSLYM